MCCALAADMAGPSRAFVFRDRACDPFARAGAADGRRGLPSHSPASIFSPLCRPTGDGDGAGTPARRRGLRVAGDDSWSDIFSKLLVARIEPRLGLGRPTLLYEYPRCEAALARATSHDLRVAERFELYACGVELANGFGELTDAEEQRRRFEAEMDEKERVYDERYPIDEELLAALAIMPEASGVALGFDRLVMLALGAPRIDDVIWTPHGDDR